MNKYTKYAEELKENCKKAEASGSQFVEAPFTSAAAEPPPQNQVWEEYNEAEQILVGTKTKRFQDLDTGEIIELDQVTKKTYGQKQFWKVYLSDFLQILGILESKQIDVLIYILENTSPSTNIYLGTYRATATGAGVSQETCRKVLRKLQDGKFIKKLQNGAYQISPNIMLKGSEKKKQMLLEYFYE